MLRARREAPLRPAARKREGEHASTTGGGLGPDPSSVTLDDPAAGGEADPAAVVRAPAALEHLEDLGVLGQADAVVADREGPARLALLRGDLHARSVAVLKLQGVRDEVLKDPGQPRTACVQRRQVGDLDASVDGFDL